jgi:acylphosphatase
VIRKRVVLSGRVQGVFFRDSCQQAALLHKVAGWVTNRSDGSVEAVFEGDDALTTARDHRGAPCVLVSVPLRVP